MSDLQDPIIGRTIDQYKVENLLGRGGMSLIYLAKDLKNKKKVAIKTLPRIQNSHLFERMKREIRATASLNHKSVVRFHNHGTLPDGRPYLALDYMEGGSMQDVLDWYRSNQSVMPVEYALSLIIPIVDALSFAHRIDIIHRDLKPTNILMDRNRRSAVLADLGIAKNLRDPALTGTDAVLGTINYMSPEQAKGQPVDTRTDIYSIGVILYEMLTGYRPIEARDVTDLTFKQQTQIPIPIKQRRQNVPYALSEIVQSCLQVDPNRRIGSMDQLKRYLSNPQQYLIDNKIPDEDVRRKSNYTTIKSTNSGPNGVVTFGIVLFLLILLAGLIYLILNALT